MADSRRQKHNPLGAVLCLLLLTSGCDAFTPRTAPPPCDPLTDPTCRPPGEFKEPLSPEVVRDNIIAAMESFTVTPNYIQSIAAKSRGERPFTYLPDPGLNEVFPGFFDGWEEEREVQFMLDLLQSGSNSLRTVDLNVTTVTKILGHFPDTDRARYTVEYDLLLLFVDSSVDPPVETTQRYCATALWDFIGGNRNFWRLQRWEEINPSGEADCLGSMGLLRATTGQGL